MQVSTALGEPEAESPDVSSETATGLEWSGEDPVAVLSPLSEAAALSPVESDPGPAACVSG